MVTGPLKTKLIRAFALLGEARTLVEEVRDDSQTIFDDKSEAWQESDKGEALQAEIEVLNEACSSLEEIESNIEDATKGE